MREVYPALINIKAFGDQGVAYNENLCFRSEPDEIDVGCWISFIRPSLKHNGHFMMEYIRPLKQTEK